MDEQDRWPRFVWVKGDVEPTYERERTAEDIEEAEKGFEKLFGRKLISTTHPMKQSGADTAATAHQ